MKVIFIFEIKFTKRDFSRFGLNIIKDRGHEVEVWEVHSLFRKKYSDYYKPKDAFHFNELIIFNSMEDFKVRFNDINEKCVVIDSFNFISSLNFSFEKNFLLGATLSGLLPTKEKIFLNRLRKALSNPIKLIKYIKRKIQNKNKNNNLTLDFLLKGGIAANYDYRYKTNKYTIDIKTHAFDYDRFLEEEKNLSIKYKNKPDYAVFLDEDMCFHPDNAFLDIEPFCTPENYFPDLNKFFNIFENNTGYEIIIAAHPSANYSKSINYFNGRKIISNKTAELVKYSKMVLLHASTSVNFCVLYQKPGILIDSLKYAQILRDSIKNLSTVLGLPLVEVTSKDNLETCFRINKKKYLDYKQKYIKENDTLDKNTWEIFCDYLEEVNI